MLLEVNRMVDSQMHSSRSAQMIEDLETALTWMASLGVVIHPGRQPAYRKMAEKWEDFADGRGKLGLRELHPIVATFAYEVPAFVLIHRAFGGAAAAQLGGLVALLSEAASGAIRIDDVRGAGFHPARDAMFRMLAAAYVQKVALDGKVALGLDATTSFGYGRHHLFVESRRLGLEAGIAAGLGGACRQLVQAFDGRQGAKNRGLIALDASAVIRRPGDALPTEARATMDATADNLLAQFADDNMPTIQGSLRGMDRRIIGAMILLSTVAVAADDGAFVHVGRWALVWRDHINFSDYDLLGRMRDQMRVGA